MRTNGVELHMTFIGGLAKGAPNVKYLKEICRTTCTWTQDDFAGGSSD